MNKRIALLVTLCASVASASAATLTSNDKDQKYAEFVATEKLSDIDKISSFKFRNWTGLTDNYLLVRDTKKQDYLIELSARCYGLNKVKAIKLNRSSNFSLDAQHDTISLIGKTNDECRIESIFPVNAEQYLALSNV